MKERVLQRAARWGVAALVVALVLACAAFWFLQRQAIYQPKQELPPIDTVLPGGEDVSFQTSDGLTLHAWFVAPIGSVRGAVLILHGIGGNRADQVVLAKALSAAGYAVLLTDYRGYGGNPGSPTESGLAQDAVAAREYLATRPEVDPQQIAYFGESLGGGVATVLAAHEHPAALILRSPFTTLPDAIGAHYPAPFKLLIRDHYPVLELIGSVDAPLLVIAGGRDRTVPLSQSREVFDQAAQPKRFVEIPTADHGDPALVNGPEMQAAVVDFLNTYLKEPAVDPGGPY